MQRTARKRTREEIYREVLTKAKDGIRVTEAIYSCRFNWEQYQKHFGFLIDNEFLKYNQEDKLFYTTMRGEKFIGTLDRMKKFKNKMPPELVLRAANLIS